MISSSDSGISNGTGVLATFEDTVKNLLKMNPKPHKEDTGSSKSQSSKDDQSSSKRATKERNSDDD
jgi:hypothetical protein